MIINIHMQDQVHNIIEAFMTEWLNFYEKPLSCYVSHYLTETPLLKTFSEAYENTIRWQKRVSEQKGEKQMDFEDYIEELLTRPTMPLLPVDSL